MAGKKPKPLSFLLCEDIRREQGGKASLLGVITNGASVIANKDGQWKLAQLCIYAQFVSDGSEHDAYIEILDPNGNELVKTESSRVTGFKEAIVMTVKVSNFVLPSAGGYTFNVYFDDKKITQQFEFKLKPYEEEK